MRHVSRTDHDILLWLASLLREERRSPATWSEPEIQRALRLSAEHGIQPLLHRAACQATPGTMPPRLCDQLGQVARDAAALDIISAEATKELLERFSQRGIRAVLLKGAALGHLYYPAPELRPHLDVDVLIADRDRSRASETLVELGYDEQPAVTGAHVRQQTMFARENGARQFFHLHWKISNSPAFCEMLTFEEIWTEATPILGLGGHARAPCAPHLLLHACAHRVAHHHASRRLIWLYDIDLLVRAMDDAACAQFVSLAIERRLSAVCLDGLGRASELLETPLPEQMVAALRAASSRQDELTGRFLDPDLGPLQHEMLELRALPGWSSRLQFIREQLLPSRAYMAWRYGTRSRLLLPFLYAHRALRGALAHLARRR